MKWKSIMIKSVTNKRHEFLSPPRRRGARFLILHWIPAFAGMTKCLRWLSCQSFGIAILFTLALAFPACSDTGGDNASPADTDSDEIAIDPDGDLDEEPTQAKVLHNCSWGDVSAPPCGDAEDCALESRCGTLPQGYEYRCSREGICSVHDAPVEEDGDEVDAIEEMDKDAGETVDLPVCGDGVKSPCILEDYPYAFTNDKGEFRLGRASSYAIEGIGVWEGWIAAFQLPLQTYSIDCGALVHNLDNQVTIRLADCGSFALQPFVQNDIVIFPDRAPDSTEENKYDNLYLFDLYLAKQQIISRFNSDKTDAKTSNGFFYWEDDRLSPGTGYFNLYSIDETTGEEFNVDSGKDFGYLYDVFGDTLVYEVNGYMIYYHDRASNTEILLPPSEDNNGHIRGLALWDKKVYWSDYRMVDGLLPPCGLSVIERDLRTGEERIVVPFDGADRMLGDVWEDWLVYADYTEGGGHEGYETCCGSGNGDIILVHLPTGDRWNLSDAPGNQWQPQIWKNLVVWEDSRETPDVLWTRTEDLYGVDLCRFPEVKDRFPTCGERKKKAKKEKK